MRSRFQAGLVFDWTRSCVPFVRLRTEKRDHPPGRAPNLWPQHRELTYRAGEFDSHAQGSTSSSQLYVYRPGQLTRRPPIHLPIGTRTRRPPSY